ncbi:J domain-containing protein [Qipengyuania vesicularis]|uniref:J domain-containing protein n=1 Tax=Qipengyuania vesicularis TaxID=2867232 RepID=UPI001C87D50C|nr:J domain-containing protein [Qipengyuania vesicularis]MBX7528341.1 J domain-containing protein [Qipengyuania vesicularis]
MIKILMFAVALSVFCRWALGKWPWDYLRPAPTRSQAIFRARQLLNVSAKADHKEIREAHRRLSAMAHPDRGGSKTQMQELNAARDLLLDDLPYETPEPPQ